MKQRSIYIKDYFLNDINAVIRFLIISDVVLSGAASLLGPIFALFVEDFIYGSTAATVGMAASIYLVSKSIFQIPAAAVIDRIRGEKDDFWIMFIFTIIIGLIPLSYIIMTESWQLYLIQFLLGLFTAFTFPSYMAIFTRHIDKKKEGTEWGIYFTLTDLAAAAFAAIGGYIAASVGFKPLIIIVVCLSLVGAFLLYPIRPYIKLK